MFSIVFFLWRKLQCEKERGREEHCILNSLQEIIAKPLLLSSDSPSLPGFSDFPLSSRIWQITATETAGAGGPDALARASPRCASCFSSSWGSRVPTCGCHKGTFRRFCLGKDGLFFPLVVWVFPLILQLSVWPWFSSGGFQGLLSNHVRHSCIRHFQVHNKNHL